MESKIIRVAQGKESTLSQLYINGIFQCYLLEDKIREVKIASQTAIPKGVFSLKLNTYGAKNVDYKKAFGKLHQGMIEIIGLPNFSHSLVQLSKSFFVIHIFSSVSVQLQTKNTFWKAAQRND